MDKWLLLLEKFGILLDRPGWPRRIITGVGVAAAVTLANFAWKHQDSLIPQIASSQFAVPIIAGAVSCIVLWLAGSWLLERMDRKGDALELYLRAQVQQLTAKLDEADDRANRMNQTIDELIEREDACQRRLGRAEDALRGAGLMPPRSSDWTPYK